MEPPLLDLILKDNFTPSSCLRRLRLLKTMVEAKLFQKNAQAKQELPVEDAAWVSNLNPKYLASFKGETYEKEFQAAEAAIKAIQTLTIFVPFSLPDAQIEELGKKLRQSYGDQFLFEVKVDPGTIAGCALAWKGIYRDYSLRKRMDEQKSLVLSTLKQYVKH